MSFTNGLIRRTERTSLGFWKMHAVLGEWYFVGRLLNYCFIRQGDDASKQSTMMSLAENRLCRDEQKGFKLAC